MAYIRSPRLLPWFAVVAATALFVAGCSSPSSVNQTAHSAPLPITPAPAHAQRTGGHTVLKPGAVVLVKSQNKKAMAIAKQLAQRVAATRHFKLTVHAYKKTINRDGAIILALGNNTDALARKGAYTLTIGHNRVTIDARNAAGLYYGTVTLWQLLTAPHDAAANITLPNVAIKDKPRFSWRGMMLDSARHFQTPDQIKKMIDWMSLHKLNILHWHLTDDQGWRIEIPKYPKLTQIGACRKAISADVAITGSPKTPYCGYYTDAQIKDIVAYAQAHYVTIVPEIDIPGHMQAAIASYPWLGVTGQRPQPSTDWGINSWLINPNQRSIRFLHTVFDTVMALFPSRYIHIGGDEAIKTQWKHSPAVQALRTKLGLKDMDALQGWLVTKMTHYLAQHGRIAVGWDEVLSGDVPQSTVIMSWNGVSGAITAAAKGHDTVLSPSPRLYLDHIQSSLPNEPAGRPQVESLKDIYSFNPVPASLTPSQAKHVLGLQANLWAEYMPTFARVQHAAFPRMSAWSEVAWSPASAINWHNFLARMPAQIARAQALGIAYADSAWAPKLTLNKAEDTGSKTAQTITVTLSNQVHQGIIRYTTDGDTPTPKSTRYQQPLSVPADATTALKAATFTPDGLRLAAPRSYTINAQALLTRVSSQLTPCSKSIVLRIEDDRPIDGKRPFYDVNIADMCWKWPQANLQNVSKIALTVGNLPWNYKIPYALDSVVTHPQKGAYPALNVYLDYCAGQQIAHISLRKATRTQAQTTLTAKLPALGGKHDLCFMITGNPMTDFWGLGKVQLIK